VRSSRGLWEGSCHLSLAGTVIFPFYRLDDTKGVVFALGL
jgi:hypothetical protein